MSLEKVIRVLTEHYEHAKENPVIHKPMAWALYQTWKQVDVLEKPKEDNE